MILYMKHAVPGLLNEKKTNPSMSYQGEYFTTTNEKVRSFDIIALRINQNSL